MNDNFPWPRAGKPLCAEAVLIEIDDTIKEAVDEIAPGGPTYEPGRILEIVKRRVQFVVDHNACLFPEEHVARRMLTVSFVRSRMKAYADDLDQRFLDYAIDADGEIGVRFRKADSGFIGNDANTRISGVIFPDDDGDPVVSMGMKF